MKARNDNRTPKGDPDTATNRVVLTGREARQGDIILRTRRRRIIFILGLAGLVLVAVLVRMIA